MGETKREKDDSCHGERDCRRYGCHSPSAHARCCQLVVLKTRRVQTRNLVFANLSALRDTASLLVIITYPIFKMVSEYF